LGLPKSVEIGNLSLNKAVIRWMSVVQDPSRSYAIGQYYGEANAVSIDPGRGGGFYWQFLCACPDAGACLSSTGAHRH
jgi:hypothetical protein